MVRQGRRSARSEFLASLGRNLASSLADFVSSYNVIRELRTVPIDRKLLFQVATQAAAPLAIVWFVATPADRIVAGLHKMLL
jgi:hypothetical protein